MTNNTYYTPVDNDLFEYLMKLNKASQIKIIMCIVRFTNGFHVEKAKISVGRISKYTGLSLRCVKRELAELEKMKIIERKTTPGEIIKSVCLTGDLSDTGDTCVTTDGDTAVTTDGDTADTTPGDNADTHKINNIYKKNSLKKESKKTHAREYSPELIDAVNNWGDIHRLNNKSMQVLMNIVNRYMDKYGQKPVADTINECIAEGRGSIYFDRLDMLPKKEDSDFDIEMHTWAELSDYG